MKIDGIELKGGQGQSLTCWCGPLNILSVEEIVDKIPLHVMPGSFNECFEVSVPETPSYVAQAFLRNGDQPDRLMQSIRNLRVQFQRKNCKLIAATAFNTPEMIAISSLMDLFASHQNIYYSGEGLTRRVIDRVVSFSYESTGREPNALWISSRVIVVMNTDFLKRFALVEGGEVVKSTGVVCVNDKSLMIIRA